MREDFAQTSRFQVQSTSDQQDYRLYPVIAATAPLMVLPEQAASWAYPQAEMDAEQTAFNINTTFLGRFFLSGYINQMEEWQKNIIQQGIQAYREHVQPMIGESVPLWPLGLPSWDSAVVGCEGLSADDSHRVGEERSGNGEGGCALLATLTRRGRSMPNDFPGWSRF